MTLEQLKRELQNVIERYRNKEEFTGEVRRDSMAWDCLSAIKELEAENEKLKTANVYAYDCNKSSKWISVKDRMPNEKEQNELLWIAYVSTDNTIKYMYEASFDYETKQFYTENDWGDKTFVEPSIWMVVPLPTTPTEKSSATEKENG